MSFSEEALVCILAMDNAFPDYEFIHVYLGGLRYRRQAAKLSADQAYRRLKELAKQINVSGITDEPPRWRKTYVLDLINCVLAQYETFVLKKRNPFVETVSRLTAAPPLPQFRLEPELLRLRAKLRDMGFKSIPEFERSKKRLKFKSRGALTDHVYISLETIINRLAKKCGGAFGFDLKKELNPARLKITVPGKDEPPCFYRYEGSGRGTMGVEIRAEFTEAYLQGFIAHEAVPGHHLYYIVKQKRIERGETDALDCMDTFYSPENAVNEGLAVCSDRLFGQLLDEPAHFSSRFEKFLHRVMYNSWHDVNVLHRASDAGMLRLCENEFGFLKTQLAAKLRYYTRDARFYTPAYPLGIAAIERFPKGLQVNLIPRLYEQHSINTLRRLLPWLTKKAV
jgi:hypothetical protein